ncbi:MAG: hypothetical protein ACRDJV_11190 [Actinomycetota bacterium]
MTGAVIAGCVRLPERLAAAITAFGGGLLLAAIALELGSSRCGRRIHRWIPPQLRVANDRSEADRDTQRVRA